LIPALISLLSFGGHYAFDVPASLPKQFKALAGGGKHATARYELLYTYCAIPAMVSLLLDRRFGPHACAVAVVAIVTLGCLLVTIGCQASPFGVVLFGRFVMGLGGEATFALQQALCTWWITSDIQPLAMSLEISNGALGEIATGGL